jgi:hypothetical protein
MNYFDIYTGTCSSWQADEFSDKTPYTYLGGAGQKHGNVFHGFL